MDLIERQAAIDALTEYGNGRTVYIGVEEAVRRIKQLPSAQPDLIAKIQNGINATNANDSYSCGMRNGMRWCMSLVDDKEPLFENCPSAQPEVLACGEGELSAQPKPRTNGSITCIKAEKTHDRTTGGCISRRAVEHLDWFTKLYCRDKSITDDLAFRCKQCEFAMPDGICLVKTMARKLCPDYKDFGAMGDL